MSYDYRTERPFIFTEDGQLMFLAIRDKTKALISKAGAARCDKMIEDVSGSSWSMLACVDRLVELGEIHEVSNTTSGVLLHRIFTSFDQV